jgi:hypothetical protein
MNDEAFFEAGAVSPLLALLEGQSRQLVRLPTEAPIFLVGALKNISSSDRSQERLGKLGAIPILCGLVSSSFGLSDERLQVQLLTQSASVLRNLSLSKAHHKQV